MNINVLDIVYYSWLNKFLYTTDNIILWHEDKWNSFIIALNLTIKEISFIKENFDKFKWILENILYTFNQSSDKYFKNITFNKVKIWDEMYNNCIFLYNSEQNLSWFIQAKDVIEFPTRKEALWIDIYDKIYNLAENNNLSVRNLIKLWIKQIKARKFYEFLKEKEIIVISKYNNNNKKYNLEKLLKILEIAKNKSGV